MAWIAGVDGCRGGWMMALVNPQTVHRTGVNLLHCRTFHEVLEIRPRPVVIAVDIPIGLLSKRRVGGRVCDQAARSLLGPRRSSVFSPPIRGLLRATRYEQVRGRGVSIQTFGILPKIREVDACMTPTLQRRIFEAHPELAFRQLACSPMRFNKKTNQGRRERLRRFQHLPNRWMESFQRTGKKTALLFRRSCVADDDILDALVLVYTAYRIVQATARCLPDRPPVDDKGLRMEIWY